MLRASVRPRLVRHAVAATQLAPPTWRVLPWWHLAAGGLLAATLVVLTGIDADTGPSHAVNILRFATVPLVLGVAFVLDDPVEPDQTGAPIPISLRRLLRLVPVVCAVALLWAALLVSVEVRMSTGGVGTSGLPVRDLTVELAALMAASLAVASVVSRRIGSTSGGTVAAPGVLGLIALFLLLPTDWGLYTPYVLLDTEAGAGDEIRAVWEEAHRRWATLGVVGVATLAWTSRDPARPHPARSRR